MIHLNDPCVQTYKPPYDLTSYILNHPKKHHDMYIYRITFGSVPEFGFSMAISLFRSVVNCIVLMAADCGAKKLGGSGLFG